MDDNGAGDRQGHSAPVWRNPAVVAAAVGVVGVLGAALIALAKPDAEHIIVVPPITTTNSPTPVSTSASPVPEDPPAVGVPAQALGRWRGGVGFTGYEVPADLTVATVPVGESVGDFKTQVALEPGPCVYRALLMSVDVGYITFQTSKVKGGAFCAEWGLVRLDFDGRGRAAVTQDGLSLGTLYRS